MNFTYGVVPSASLYGMILSGVIAIVVPILLAVIWKKTQDAKVSSFFVGCLGFLIFAMVLEQIFHSVVLGATGTSISGNLVLYALYGGLAAGFFEEVGRFLCMKVIMRKTLSREDSIMYGIGHGGIEAILIIGISEISNIATSLSINAGTIDAQLQQVSEESRNQLYQQISQLWTTQSHMFYAAGLERLTAMTFHICASYLVYKAIAEKKVAFFFLALLLHVLLDSVTVFLNGLGVNIWGIEAFLVVFSAVLLFFVVRDYRNCDFDD